MTIPAQRTKQIQNCIRNALHNHTIKFDLTIRFGIAATIVKDMT